MKRLFFGASAAMLMGCVVGTFSDNPTHHYAIYIDPAFSADQANAIMAGATDWQTKLEGFVTFSGTLVDGGPDTISVYPVPNQAALYQACDTTSGILGCEQNDGIPSHIFLPLTGDSSFQQVATHEIGHSLGARHIAPGNVMCWASGCAATTVQCGDVEEVQRAWGAFSFDSSQLSVCQKQ